MSLSYPKFSFTAGLICHIWTDQHLSHDQDTIHAEKGCAEMCDFCMATLMFLTGHGIMARTYACVEIAHFPMRCIIRTWEAQGL